MYLSNLHMNKNLPTLVSYQGGSAGDLFTASLNSLELNFKHNPTVKIPQHSIKDASVRSVEEICVLLKGQQCGFVSTHEFDLLLGSNLKWINVIVTDPGTQELCVLRQMHFQNLQISVDESSDWYRIVKSLCLRNKWESAAKYWLEQSRRLWINNMNKRNQYAADNTACFDQLFDQNFVWSIKQQGFDCGTLEANHSAWLKKNFQSRWNSESTIQSISQKLCAMNWQQTSGVIRYRA